MEEGTTKYRRQIGRFRIIVGLLSLLSLALLIALIVVLVRSHATFQSLKPDTCGGKAEKFDLSQPKTPPPFHDLTPHEIKSVKEYLYRPGKDNTLNLVKPSEIQCNNSYIYNIELIVPNKDVTLRYLDEGKEPPPREAHVVVFRGDKQDPHVEEFIVGALPSPTYTKEHVVRPFRFRPITAPEIIASTELLIREVHEKAANIILETYGGKLVNCDDNCYSFAMVAPMSTMSSGDLMTRKTWFWLTPAVEFWSLYPMDFSVLVDTTGKDPAAFKIDTIYHAGEKFDTLDDLQQAYNDGSLRKKKIPYPNVKADPFATLTRHGTMFPNDPLPAPQEFEPAGKRYSIKNRHISYMGWDFDLRMSTISGPQLFDIRFQGDRIVYELSLQELAVYYSANSPNNRFADYIDSLALIGSRARGLVPGSDCPRHSTFLSATHSIEFSEEPVVYERAFCVFEHDTAKPLRRHLNSMGTRFYGGMSDTVLTVRTIATVVNYDYVFDFIFHQNGAVEVQSLSTGYILSAFRFKDEDPYGFRLREHLTGSVHHHMFSFKADLDINGRQNRFETLKITPKVVDNTKWSSEDGATYSMTEFSRNNVKTEKEAAMKYNFSAPQYLTFYNNQHKTKYQVPKAYRLLNRGMSPNLFEEGKNQEPSISWARYQVAVTKYKETERRSSSMYAIWDSADRVVDFQGFIDDDENIVDEDQVAWITMGVHHIPHTEDFPISPTVGLDLKFSLIPYNYFDHDPAMGSSDWVRIVPNKEHGLKGGLDINRYGNSAQPKCMPKAWTSDQDDQNNPTVIFDSEEGAPPI